MLLYLIFWNGLIWMALQRIAILYPFMESLSIFIFFKKNGVKFVTSFPDKLSSWERRKVAKEAFWSKVQEI